MLDDKECNHVAGTNCQSPDQDSSAGRYRIPISCKDQTGSQKLDFKSVEFYSKHPLSLEKEFHRDSEYPNKI